VRLLFDQNLSHKLVNRLGEVFPDSQHVRDVGLADADDTSVWEFAAAGGYTIVSKDSDFHQRSFLYGAPPKVIWLRIGNCTTSDIEHLLRRRLEDIERFDRDEESSFLVLS
jgi:predicted nuclease of predicted toxin-antitoxin system